MKGQVPATLVKELSMNRANSVKEALLQKFPTLDPNRFAVEGMGWDRGGDVAWQVFGKDGKPTTMRGRSPGVPVWSLAAVFARADGGFTIVY